MPAATVTALVKTASQAAANQGKAREAAAATATQVASAAGKPPRSLGANTSATPGSSATT